MGRHVFVVPDFDSFVSGGNLYNRGLTQALSRAGARPIVLPFEEAATELSRGSPGHYWVDSLYLEHVPALSKGKTSGQRIGLIVHFLPSLVAGGMAGGELSSPEQRAISQSDAFLVPSAFVEEVLRRARGSAHGVHVIEPATEDVPLRRDEAEPGVRALVIAAVTEAKGVLPFLEELARACRPSDSLNLTVIGDLCREPDYARACTEVVRRHLSDRVRLLGDPPRAEVLACLSSSNLLVSASRMETYGMALAEARVCGVPIVARRGGAAEFHVSAHAGGVLVASPAEAADECIALARDPAEHTARLGRAKSAVVPPRPWAAAAAEFLERIGPASDGGAIRE